MNVVNEPKQNLNFITMEEIELTYLAKNVPADLKKSPSKEFIDIYIPASSAHPTLRIRRKGNVFEMTKKQPLNESDASHQIEKTISLTAAEYTDFCTIPGKRVEKTRYYYIKENLTYEIDVFKGGLLGLILVDIEFSSLKDRDSFVMPEWCLMDVTQEKFVAGGMLCGKRYADIEIDLARYGYKKLFV